MEEGSRKNSKYGRHNDRDPDADADTCRRGAERNEGVAWQQGRPGANRRRAGGSTRHNMLGEQLFTTTGPGQSWSRKSWQTCRQPITCNLLMEVNSAQGVYASDNISNSRSEPQRCALMLGNPSVSKHQPRRGDHFSTDTPHIDTHGGSLGVTDAPG
jgi:hypothetical protein